MRIEYMSFIISYLSKIRVALVVLLIKFTTAEPAGVSSSSDWRVEDIFERTRRQLDVLYSRKASPSEIADLYDDKREHHRPCAGG